MAYTLECAGSFSSPAASEADIHRALDEDHLRGEFMILTAPNGDFMQAANDDDGPFVLEHRTKATDEHICAVGELDREQTRQAFIKFLRGDATWRSDRPWKPLEATQGKVGCMSVMVLAAGAAMASWL